MYVTKAYGNMHCAVAWTNAELGKRSGTVRLVACQGGNKVTGVQSKQFASKPQQVAAQHSR
jgi:hypothetical protein